MLFDKNIWAASWQNQQNSMCAQPHRDKTNKVACALSYDSDQPGRAQWVAMDHSFVHVDSEDWTGLIWVFAGSTCHFVGFVKMRLIFFIFFDSASVTFWIDRQHRSSLYCPMVDNVILLSNEQFYCIDKYTLINRLLRFTRQKHWSEYLKSNV